MIKLLIIFVVLLALGGLIGMFLHACYGVEKELKLWREDLEERRKSLEETYPSLKNPEVPESIHTTVGVYPNWRNLLNGHSYKVNGVKSTNLKDHIEYNRKFRPGRALFVDGVCYHPGSLSIEDVQWWVRQLKDYKDQFIMKKDTAPYV